MNKRRTVAALMCGAVLYVVANIAQVWVVGRSDQARSVDAIVVMGVAQYDGRPSPQLQARLDHVLALWGTGVTQLVITTGGNQPGDRFTEARASADYLIAGGIDETLIAMESIRCIKVVSEGIRCSRRVTLSVMESIRCSGVVTLSMLEGIRCSKGVTLS